MSKLIWEFSNSVNRDKGPNDATIETFKGDTDRYLAREITQNSIDARLDEKKPVRIAFELLKLERNSIPDIDSLTNRFNQCADFWKHDKKAKEFFTRAAKLSLQRTIPCLKISDFNTTGVEGEDDEVTKGWYSLVMAEGSTSKIAGEGGSFGIGKGAPFAASQLRTVIYSTQAADDHHAFVGLSILATHKSGPKALKSHHEGFLTLPGKKSVRERSKIPSHFSRKDRGTDIFVLGYDALGEKAWYDDLLSSMLENFWPAIDKGLLEATIGDVVVNRDSLESLLTRMSKRKDFTAHMYYHAMKKPLFHIPSKLEKIGQVEFFVSTGDPSFPNRVSMIRKSGMVIFQKRFQSPTRFCGVFICEDQEGNERLREMEPPRHDVWDPNHPEKGQNRKIETEYVGFIRDSLRALADNDDAQQIEISELSRFLPDDEDTPDETFGSGTKANDTLEEDRPTTEGYEPSTSTLSPAKSLETRKRETPGTQGRIDSPTPTPDPLKPKKSHIKEPAPATKRNTKDPVGEISSRPIVPIAGRTFFLGTPDNEYRASIRPVSQEDGEKEVYLTVQAIGDDQRAAIPIESATLPDGATVPIVTMGVIGPIQLDHSKPVVLTFATSIPLRLSLEIIANEA